MKIVLLEFVFMKLKKKRFEEIGSYFKGWDQWVRFNWKLENFEVLYEDWKSEWMIVVVDWS